MNTYIFNGIKQYADDSIEDENVEIRVKGASLWEARLRFEGIYKDTIIVDWGSGRRLIELIVDNAYETRVLSQIKRREI